MIQYNRMNVNDDVFQKLVNSAVICGEVLDLDPSYTQISLVYFMESKLKVSKIS